MQVLVLLSLSSTATQFLNCLYKCFKIHRFIAVFNKILRNVLAEGKKASCKKYNGNVREYKCSDTSIYSNTACNLFVLYYASDIADL